MWGGMNECKDNMAHTLCQVQRLWTHTQENGGMQMRTMRLCLWCEVGEFRLGDAYRDDDGRPTDYCCEQCYEWGNE